MRTRTVAYALMAVIALTVAPAMGQGKGKGKEKHNKDEKREQGTERARSRDDDERIVHQYFVNTAALPPGLARRKTLPPGLERQLRVNGTLPPGLAKRMQPAPVTLTRQLVPLPSTQRRVIIGNRLVVLDEVNRVIDLFLLP